MVQTLPSSRSHACPMPFPVLACWSGFGTVGQLSQASPTSSPSASSCRGLKTRGQLSPSTRRPVRRSVPTSSKWPSRSRSRRNVRFKSGGGEMKVSPPSMNCTPIPLPPRPAGTPMRLPKFINLPDCELKATSPKEPGLTMPSPSRSMPSMPSSTLMTSVLPDTSGSNVPKAAPAPGSLTGRGVSNENETLGVVGCVSFSETNNRTCSSGSLRVTVFSADSPPRKASSKSPSPFRSKSVLSVVSAPFSCRMHGMRVREGGGRSDEADPRGQTPGAGAEEVALQLGKPERVAYERTYERPPGARCLPERVEDQLLRAEAHEGRVGNARHLVTVRGNGDRKWAVDRSLL